MHLHLHMHMHMHMRMHLHMHMRLTVRLLLCAEHVATSLRYVKPDGGEGSEDTLEAGEGKGRGSRVTHHIPEVVCLTNMECAQRGHIATSISIVPENSAFQSMP